MQDVRFNELLNPIYGDYSRYSVRTLEKIECYGDSIQDVIIELNNELRWRGIPKIVRRDDGQYTCGEIDIVYEKFWVFSRHKIKTKTNLVWITKRGNKYIIAVYVPRLRFVPLVVKMND